MKIGVISTLYIFLFFLATGCNPIQNSKYAEYLSVKYEIPECTTNYTYTSTTTLSGTAEFYKRSINVVVQDSKVINMHLGDPVSTPLPIRMAEVVVYDWTNQIVQCGTTDADGLLKGLDGVSALQIPKAAGNYSVRVYSRIHQTLSFPGKPDFDINVAVKKDKYTNELYYLQATAQSNGIDDTSVALTAYARQTESQELNGGAFNILNSIYTAYDYIRSNTGPTNTTCLNEKLNVYWKVGFNPWQYQRPNDNPSYLPSNSFYDQSDDTLYITGGKLGNINLERTDHFGDYVIIHELGHHVENKCGSLLTPGGNHAVIARIDPRLAWAEGWANYFSAKVLFNSIDTVDPDFRIKVSNAGVANTNWTYFFGSEGFSDSVQNIGNGTGFMFDLKRDGKNPDTWQDGPYLGLQFDAVDPSRYKGEGHFREGAVTRGLFKLTTACGSEGSCIDSVSGTPLSFSDIWSSMDNITGIGQASTYPLKSSELLLQNLKNSMGSGWNTFYKTFNEANTSEALHLFSDGAYTSVSGGTTINRWLPYGQPLQSRISGGGCPSGVYYIEPRSDDPLLTATNSDQRYSNHYYLINLNQLNWLDQISATFSKVSPTGTSTEFDILLYKQNYFFNIDYACTTKNAAGDCIGNTPSRGTTADVVKSDRRSGLSLTTKTIRGLSSLDKNQYYVLNIRAYTPGKSLSSTTDYQYTLTDQNGDTLCPDP